MDAVKLVIGASLIFNEPDIVILYGAIPVNASTDWVTFHASTAFPSVMLFFESVFAICGFVYKYQEFFILSIALIINSGWIDLVHSNCFSVFLFLGHHSQSPGSNFSLL